MIKQSLLLDKAIKFVPQYGWTSAAIAAAAAAAATTGTTTATTTVTLSPAVAGVVTSSNNYYYENGGENEEENENAEVEFQDARSVLLNHFISNLNRQLIAEYSLETKGKALLEALTPKDRLLHVMERRIELTKPHAEIWSLALKDLITSSSIINSSSSSGCGISGIMKVSNRFNPSLGLKLLADTADTICLAARHHDADFNYYTKRTMVGTIFAITETRMLSEVYRKRHDYAVNVKNEEEEWRHLLRKQLNHAISIQQRARQYRTQGRTMVNIAASLLKNPWH